MPLETLVKGKARSRRHLGPPAARRNPALPLQQDQGVQQIAVTGLQGPPGLLIGDCRVRAELFHLFQSH